MDCSKILVSSNIESGKISKTTHNWHFINTNFKLNYYVCDNI